MLEPVLDFFSAIGSELFVATFALLLTIFAAWQSRRHNRLTVRPHLDWNTAKVRAANSLMISFHLRNAGLGPAIITGYHFKIDHSLFLPTTRDVVGDLANECLKGVVHEVVLKELPGIGSALMVGQSLCIAKIEILGLQSEAGSWFEDALDRADFEVSYESLYKERFMFSTATVKEFRKRTTPPQIENVGR